MAETTAMKLPLEPPPVRISRTFHAPRELVFKAWSSADHVKRWFATFCNIEATPFRCVCDAWGPPRWSRFSVRHGD